MQIGDKVPDFTLYNSEKEKVTLSGLQGQNVLLLFFPLAFTSVCTAELCAVSSDLNGYKTVNATVLGISVDSLYTLARFKAENNIGFQLLSDFNKEVSKSYNSLYETFGFDMKGVSKRSAFVIDKEGILRYSEILENAGEQPNFDTINKTLAEL